MNGKEKTSIIKANLFINKPYQSYYKEPSIIDMEEKVKKIDIEIEKLTNKADTLDYEISIASGLLCALIDSIFVGDLKVTSKDIAISHKQVNNFIIKYAKSKGFKGDRLNEAIAFLEKKYKVPQDNIWKGKHIGISPKDHHIADFAHHPTPIGLVSSIVVALVNVGVFVNKDGKWHILATEEKNSDYYLPQLFQV